MCGFVGFYSNKKYDKSVIENMSQKIEHRGPDSAGYFLDENVNIGFRRLSFVDVKGGEQPISNASDDIVIVFNGEIYNYLDLRKDLIEKGYKFKTLTDTEVILIGYQEYGIEGILSKLRGMFAFTIYDKRDNKIIGARDHFGIKPYYYCDYSENSTLLFSSEIKAFLPFPDFKKQLNEKALKNYLVFQYNPLEETFFKNVKKLKAGHYFIYENGNLEINRFFKPEFDYVDESESEVIKRIDDAVQESVAAHKTGEFEIGSFLSGGVDSSYIVASTVPNKTFSVGFDTKGLSNP
ncbi:MAG: asparagine synthase (glutamine-hydrolyzing), partial [Anaerococcus obesiensis]